MLYKIIQVLKEFLQKLNNMLNAEHLEQPQPIMQDP